MTETIQFNQFTKWEDLSQAEQDLANYYDFYKSVHGIKPRWLSIEHFQNPEEVKDMFDILSIQAEQEAEIEAERTAESILKFEEYLNVCISSGARDRKTALKWIMSACNCTDDWGMLSYTHNLPYDYFKNDMKAGVIPA